MGDASDALKSLPGSLAWLAVQLLLVAAWIGLLAYLPWWSVLALLLTLDAACVWCSRRTLGTADQWLLFYGALGLAGLAISLAQAHGGSLWGWLIGVAAACIGFVWKLYLMQRFDLPRRASKTAVAEAEPIAAPPIAAPIEITEPASLLPVHWREAEEANTRAAREAIWQRGEPVYVINGEIRFGPATGDYLWPDGAAVMGWAGSRYAMSDDGRWFVAAPPVAHREICDALYDRTSRLVYDLRSWEIHGWSEQGPWLARPGEAPMSLDRTGVIGTDYLPLRDVWLPRSFFTELPLARQTLRAPAGPHAAMLDIALPDRLLDGDDPLACLRRPWFRLAVDGEDSGLRLYGVYGQPWSDDGQILRVSAWLADAPYALPEPWRWSRLTGWLRDERSAG
jgi:hypothetical protein